MLGDLALKVVVEARVRVHLKLLGMQSGYSLGLLTGFSPSSECFITDARRANSVDICDNNELGRDSLTIGACSEQSWMLATADGGAGQPGHKHFNCQPRYYARCRLVPFG